MHLEIGADIGSGSLTLSSGREDISDVDSEAAVINWQLARLVSLNSPEGWRSSYLEKEDAKLSDSKMSRVDASLGHHA